MIVLKIFLEITATLACFIAVIIMWLMVIDFFIFVILGKEFLTSYHDRPGIII